MGGRPKGELAFDPFALMDEQPESGATTLTLVPTPIDPENEPATWTVEDVAAYLVELGLGEYCEAAQKNQVDGAMLLDLLRVPGDKGLAELGITSLLHVSKIRSQLTFHKGALLGPGASAGHGLRPCASGVAPRRMVGRVCGASCACLESPDLGVSVELRSGARTGGQVGPTRPQRRSVVPAGGIEQLLCFGRVDHGRAFCSSSDVDPPAGDEARER